MNFDQLLDLFFPALCVGCGGLGKYLCIKCLKKDMKQIYQQPCPICHEVCFSGKGIHQDCLAYSYLDGLYSVAAKSDLLELLLSKGKYGFQYKVYDDLGKLLAVKSQEWDLGADPIVSFVPLSDYRLNWRGFNQSYLLARGLAAGRTLKVAALLARRHNKHNQVGLTKELRLQNLHNQFYLLGESERVLEDEVGLHLEGTKQIQQSKTVLLVDDVYTTGATLQQSAKAIKEKHPGVEVIGITVLRA